jgi:hypothetical protein
VGLSWVPGHAVVRVNEIADKPASDGSVQRFVGPELSWEYKEQDKTLDGKPSICYCGVVLVVHRERLEN